MSRKDMVPAKYLADLNDLARNVAGLDEDFLRRCDAERLRILIREYRKQARRALDSAP